MQTDNRVAILEIMELNWSEHSGQIAVKKS